MTVIPIAVGALGTIPKGLVKGLKDLEIRSHPDYSIIKISQNTERSPVDLRRLDVPQTNAGGKNSQRRK